MQIFHLIEGKKLFCAHSEPFRDLHGAIDAYTLCDGANRIIFKVPSDRVNYIKYTREPYGDR